MDLRLEAALMGNLEEFEDGIKTAVATAGRETMVEIRDKGIGRLRTSLKQAGLDAIEKTWRGDIFPERGQALNPAIFIYSRAPEIVNANQGEVIRGKGGGWLAIPIPGSPAEDFKNPPGPGTKIDVARQKFGDRLFMIPARRGRPAMLAVEGAGITKTGRVTLRKQNKSGQWGKGTQTVFLFWMVPQVTLEPRLDTKADFAWIEKMFEEEYPRILAQNLVRAGLGN
ncbi:MAG: DUF6441 family protein [Hyphomonas sp.]|nr:DUF6441 family protein [Hyphomonas sp.]